VTRSPGAVGTHCREPPGVPSLTTATTLPAFAGRFECGVRHRGICVAEGACRQAQTGARVVRGVHDYGRNAVLFVVRVFSRAALASAASCFRWFASRRGASAASSLTGLRARHSCQRHCRGESVTSAAQRATRPSATSICAMVAAL